MRMRDERDEGTPFPAELEHLWGKAVDVECSVARRTVIEFPGEKGKMVKMPVVDLANIRIDGYDSVIPAATVMGPAFWRSKAKRFDKIEFTGTLIKERGRNLGFSRIKNIKVCRCPVQSKLEDFTEVDIPGEDIWSS